MGEGQIGDEGGMKQGGQLMGKEKKKDRMHPRRKEGEGKEKKKGRIYPRQKRKRGMEREKGEI